MQCDHCGCNLPKGEQVQDTRSEQIEPPSRYHGNTRTVLITLCPACAHKRRRMLWFVLGFLVLLVVGLLAIALLARLAPDRPRSWFRGVHGRSGPPLLSLAVR
jgi:hypothetical protein